TVQPQAVLTVSGDSEPEAGRLGAAEVVPPGSKVQQVCPRVAVVPVDHGGSAIRSHLGASPGFRDGVTQRVDVTVVAVHKGSVHVGIDDGVQALQRPFLKEGWQRGTVGGAVAVGGGDDVVHGGGDVVGVGAQAHEGGVVSEPAASGAVRADGEPDQRETEIDQNDPAFADLGQPRGGHTRQTAGGDDPVVRH